MPAGSAPRSVAEHNGLVYVLGTAPASVTGFRLTHAGLAPIERSEQALSSPNADPAQVGSNADGSALIVTELATNSIIALPVGADGLLGPGRAVPSSGPTPYCFALTNSGTLVVTEAFGAEKGAAAASTYAVDGATITALTKSAGNGRSEICWAVVAPGGRFALTTNFADGAVSRWQIGGDGILTLDDATAGVAVDGMPGLRDLGLTSDGKNLYAIDSDSGKIHGWEVAADGTLSAIGSWDGLPPTVAGLAAR